MMDRLEPPDHAPEKEMLVAFLDYYRATLLLKAGGLSDADARRAAVPPSDLNLMGLVRHMAAVEHHWYQRWWRNNGEPWLFPGGDPDPDPDADMHPGADDTMAEAVAMFEREVQRSRDITVGTALDDRSARTAERDGTTFQPSMRWLLVHLIEEYARHCGHADLIRQAIDGATGD